MIFLKKNLNLKGGLVNIKKLKNYIYKISGFSGSGEGISHPTRPRSSIGFFGGRVFYSPLIDLDTKNLFNGQLVLAILIDFFRLINI